MQLLVSQATKGDYLAMTLYVGQPIINSYIVPRQGRKGRLTLGSLLIWNQVPNG